MDNAIQTMLGHAKVVIQNAYAPYSKFHVAAYLKTDTGSFGHFSKCQTFRTITGIFTSPFHIGDAT